MVSMQTIEQSSAKMEEMVTKMTQEPQQTQNENKAAEPTTKYEEVNANEASLIKLLLNYTGVFSNKKL